MSMMHQTSPMQGHFSQTNQLNAVPVALIVEKSLTERTRERWFGKIAGIINPIKIMKVAVTFIKSVMGIESD